MDNNVVNKSGNQSGAAKWIRSRRHVLIVAIVILSCPLAKAQQDPIYAQYLINPLVINPAYAGGNNMFNASLQYRTQWTGLAGNPTTVNFNSHMSVFQNRGGLGLMVIQDQLGDTKNTEFMTIYAYKIKFKTSDFSFGMQTGFIRYSSDPGMLTIRDPGDPSFTALSETKFNTGAGIMLRSDRYMIGLSAPRLLPATVSQGGQSIQLYSQNYYLFGSYVFFLSPDLRFKPSALLRATKGSPVSIDLNASLNLKELYTVGIFSRNFKSYGFLAQLQLKSFRLGYVFELPGTSTSSLNFSTHEVMVGISMGLLGYHDKVVKTF